MNLIIFLFLVLLVRFFLRRFLEERFRNREKNGTEPEDSKMVPFLEKGGPVTEDDLEDLTDIGILPDDDI